MSDLPPIQEETDRERMSSRHLATVVGLTFQRLYEGWIARQKRAAVRWIIVLALAAALVWLFLRLQDVLIPFAIAFFLASLLDPVVHNLQRGGRSRGWAVGSIFALVFAVVGLLVVLTVRLAVPQMQDLVVNADKYSQAFTENGNRLFIKYQKPLATLGIDKNPFKEGGSKTPFTGAKPILEKVTGAFAGLAGQALWLIIIPLSLFYFLLDYPIIRAKLISFVPPRQRANVDKMSMEIVEIFSAYVRGLAKVCALYAVVSSVIFMLFGLKYAVFLGMAAGVLYAVPYVGPAIAMATAAIIAITTGGSVGYAVLVVVAFAAMHVAFDYVLTPKVVGGSVGLHPLVNVFALMCGATLFGVWGMLLAVPVAASIQMALVYFFPKLAERPLMDTDNPAVLAAERAGRENERAELAEFSEFPEAGELVEK